MTAQTTARTTWTPVCRVDDLVPERGAAALVAGEQVALFRLVDGRVLAVQQHDPFSDAYVLSRGIVGTRTVDGEPVATVASPMYKQVFDLVSGRCLEAVGKSPVRGLGPDLRAFPVRVVGGVVEVAAGDRVAA
jgi:nitrite reductase (NADH) small subunit